MANIRTTKGRSKQAFAVLQIPILDARALLKDSGSARLARPTWPDPLPGVEFIKSVGGVVDRPSGPIVGWDGEMAFCRANALLHFAEDAGRGSVSFSVRYRRLFGTEDGYRLDVGFVVRCRKEASTYDIVQRVRSVLTVISGHPATELAKAGPSLASRLEEVTSRPRTESFPGIKSLIACAPALLVEHTGAVGEWPRLKRLPRRNEPSPLTVYELNGVASQRRVLRPVRGALWRLHTELEFLRAVGRLAREAPDRVDAEALVDAVARMSRPLAREYRFGLRQPPLLALCDYPHKLEEILVLADTIRDQSLGLARRLEVAAERAQRQQVAVLAARQGITVERWLSVGMIKEIVMGDKNQASGGSTINSRSLIVNSFNHLQSVDVELAAMLAKILEAAHGSGNSEAVELAEELVIAADTQKRGVFRATWERLKEVAPIVGSIAGVAAVVAKFLGLP